MPTEKVTEKLKTLPTKPGVYQYFDANGKIIYVGKAINLRNRVRSYFHASADHAPKTERLVAEIADLEWIITDSELEALLLESNLIKRHKPHFNIRLKDDKRYPYIKVEWQNALSQSGDRAQDGAGRRALLRPVHQCGRGLSDARHAAAHLSVSHLRSRDHGQRSARLPVLRHQVVQRPVHRRGDAGRISRHARSSCATSSKASPTKC